MKNKIYCLAFGNGKVSSFIPEFGDNYFCSSPSSLASLAESLVDQLDPSWGSLKVWVIEMTQDEVEKLKESPNWKG